MRFDLSDILINNFDLASFASSGRVVASWINISKHRETLFYIARCLIWFDVAFRACRPSGTQALGVNPKLSTSELVKTLD